MDLFSWLNNEIPGKLVFTMLVSMLPVVELRGGIPFGAGIGLPLPLAIIAAVAGNMLPVPFLILFTRRVFLWLRQHIPALEGFVEKLEKRAHEKKDIIVRYKFWGLLLLVAIPLPGTGAWTGALGASFLNMGIKSTTLSVSLGVLIAGILMALASTGVLNFFGV